MKKIGILLLLLFCIVMSFLGCKQQEKPIEQIEESKEVKKVQSAAEQKEEFLEQKIASMTLEQKVGQLFFCAFRRDSNNVPITVWNETIENTMQQYPIGGVVLFGENIDTAEQTKQLITDFQNHTTIPLFIGVDEEGGRVSRLHASGKLEVVEVPSAQKIGNTKDTKIAYDMASEMGKELVSLGFNVDFAPVADVNTNPHNTVIGDRAFSSDPIETGEMVIAFIHGLHANNISACVKHFPGHGDTTEDSHKGIAVAKHTLEEMQQSEWIPFKRAIEQGVDFVMTGHITTPNATTDNLPASLSYEMLTEQLRNHLHFQGIIITDALDMGAVTQYGDASFMAIKAGADMALMPFDLEKSYAHLCDAVKEGIISEQELNEKVKRILSLKYDKGYFENVVN